MQNLGLTIFLWPDPKGRALIRLRIAKSRLYEARVGIIELQKRWDRPGTGLFKFILNSLLKFLIMLMFAMVQLRYKGPTIFQNTDEGKGPTFEKQVEDLS